MEKELKIYYGSREPTQSVKETDRILFQMIDDLKADVGEEEKQVTAPPKEPHHHGIIWRFRIILCSIIILLLVIATIVVSEVTKNSTT